MQFLQQQVLFSIFFDVMKCKEKKRLGFLQHMMSTDVDHEVSSKRECKFPIPDVFEISLEAKHG
jgi:hypothetical protein